MTHTFIDNRVIPIRPGLHEALDGSEVTLNVRGVSVALTKQSERDGVAAWSLEAGLIQLAYQRSFEGLYRTHGASMPSCGQLPLLQACVVRVINRAFVQVAAKVLWSGVASGECIRMSGHPLDPALQEVPIQVARAIANIECGAKSGDGGLPNLGFGSAGFDGQRTANYFRRYNTVFLGERVPATTPLSIYGVDVSLGWHYSSIHLPPETPLADSALADILAIDAYGLCYSAALHASTIRAQNLLSPTAGTRGVTRNSSETHEFLADIAYSATSAEVLLGWGNNEGKRYLDIYAQVSDFPRRYGLVMDLERAVARLADGQAHDEQQARDRRLWLIATFVAVASIGSVYKDLFDLWNQSATAFLFFLCLAVGGIILVGAFALFLWRRRTKLRKQGP